MRFSFLFISCLFVLFSGADNIVLAQVSENYELLAPLPLEGARNPLNENVDVNIYIRGMFQLAIGIAGVLAVLRIIIGGIKYMTTEAFTGKSDAKDTIRDALIGLLLAMSAYVILYTVNPQLVNFDLTLKGLEGGAPISTSIGSSTAPTINPNSPSLEGCFDCALFPSNVPKKNFERNGCGSNPCVVNKELGRKLSLLATELEKEPALSWEVTESFPPTRTHSNACHNPGSTGGTCVDAALRSYPTMANINKFCRVAREAGLRPEYEVPTETRRADLLRSGASICPLKTVGGITGEHFSVYNN